MGKLPLSITIKGSLNGDEIRDEFLKEIRTLFLAGEPVDFVADITTESKLEQVKINNLQFFESAESPNTFHYVIQITEYTPPPPKTNGLPGMDIPDGISTDIDLGIDLDADFNLDMLDIPDLLVDVPEFGDLLSPAKEAQKSVAKAAESFGNVLNPLKDIMGDSNS